MPTSDRELSRDGDHDAVGGASPGGVGEAEGSPPSETPERPAPPARGLRRHWPRWLPPPKIVLVVVILGAFGFLVYRLRGEIGTAFHRVSPDGVAWLPAALAAEAVSFLAYAEVQHRLLVAGGAHMRHRTVASLTVAATGIANLVPGGTAPSSGWLVTQYRRYGVPLPLALWAVLAGGFVAGITVLLILLVGAFIAGLVGPWVFVGLLAVLTAAAVAGVLVAHHVPVVRRWLDRDRRLPGIGLARRVVGHIGDLGNFRATVSGGVMVYGLSMVNWVLDVAVLAVGFAVLNLPVPWRALLFAYAAAQIAGSLAPVPGGIGFVEGGMIGALTLAGTSAGAALLATVVYRLVTTLGMAGIGSMALVVVHHRTPRPARLSGQAEMLARRSREGPGSDDERPGVTRPDGRGARQGADGVAGAGAEGGDGSASQTVPEEGRP
jgi:putative heme transporter